MSDTLSASEARRIVLAAQGFALPRRAAPVTRGVARLGVLQMDSVNVLCRAHYMPLYSRGGAYDRARLDRAAWGPLPSRALFEYWGHEASLLPLSTHPLLRWRMERAERGEGIWRGLARFAAERRAYCEEVLREVAARGPTRASEITTRGRPKRDKWWAWSEPKAALEWLFWSGRLTTATRRHFERVYDVPERVLPAATLAAKTPTVAEAHRELLRVAARALGVATEDELRDYFRLPVKDARPRVVELVEEGTLAPVRIEGVAKPAFRHAAARAPRAPPSVAALVSPFDPLVWSRPRAERLFGFRYRIEIYTPAEAREHGYYVLPFLMGERFVARVDLKAARDEGVLDVHAAHVEDHAAPEEVAPALAEELARCASWLGLARVRVARRGRLAASLRTALG